MKKINIIILSGVAVLTVVVFSAFSFKTGIPKKYIPVEEVVIKDQQMVNLFVTHGHCSTPFSGKVENLKITPSSNDGNPLENMQLAFEINPESFECCFTKELTAKVKTPGVFIDTKNQENIKFKSTHVYTMGVDWYEVNGLLSIKGVENKVKFFVSGIRNAQETMASKLILEGQFDLTDWGIDYDKQVYGESVDIVTKWMHINMKIDLPQDC